MSQSWQVPVGDPGTSVLGLSAEGHLYRKAADRKAGNALQNRDNIEHNAL